MQLHAPDYIIILIVDELDRALGFYTEVLGLRLGHRSGDYAQFDTGSTRLALYTRGAMSEILEKPLAAPNASAPEFEIGFKVADVDAVYSDLVARGARPVVPPTDRFWGRRTAYVSDADGYLIELTKTLRGR